MTLTGNGEDRAIFDAGTGNDADIDHVSTILPEAESSITETRSAEDLAVSDAIRQISRGVPLPTAPRLPTTPSAPAPGAQPQGGEPEDRSTAGLMRAMLDERDKRQDLQARLTRFEQQEAERTRTADANRTPLSQRLFEDPDGAIADLRNEIVAPLEQRLENMRIQHDFALAGVRHRDGNVFADAWAAWYQQVGTGQDPDTYFKIMKAPSPGEALVAWHKETTQRAAVGDDLDAYNARIIREAFEANGMPVPPQFATPGAAQQPQAAPTGANRDASGRFAPSPPQAQRFPTATSRMGQSGGGLADRDEDGTDAAIFDSGRNKQRD